MPVEILPVQTEGSPEPHYINGFGDDHFEKILPPYLTAADKSRLKEGLQQFFPENSAQEISYDHFYSDDLDPYFKQADLIAEIRFPSWNDSTSCYDVLYTDATLLSNTCDINPDNDRATNQKQSLFAPTVNLQEYLHDLKANGYTDAQIRSFEAEVKRQKITNILYLPPFYKDDSAYIVLLDHIFQYPTQELNRLLPNITKEKIKSLSSFGFYLFIFKLSYHLCRLPEEKDR